MCLYFDVVALIQKRHYAVRTVSTRFYYKALFDVLFLLNMG